MLLLLLLLRSASTVLLLLLVLLLVLLLLRITSSTKTVATTPTCTCTSTTASTYATIILPTGHISTTIIVRLSLIELPPPATPPPPAPWRGVGPWVGMGEPPNTYLLYSKVPILFCHDMPREFWAQLSEWWVFNAKLSGRRLVLNGIDHFIDRCSQARNRVGMWWNVQRYGTSLPHFNQTPALM